MEFHRYYAPEGEQALLQRCARIRHIALDMDGTIYMGNSLFPYTKPFLETLSRLGIGYTFLTNNPTRSAADYIAKLARLGIDAAPEQMYTSSMATIDYLRAHHPSARRLFLLGTPSMQEEFVKAGYELTAEDAADRPDVLIVAFDTTLAYKRLCRAAWWASKPDIPYIATNPDWVCPTDEDTILVDCGSICKAVEGASGRKPDIVIGKPNPAMLWCIRDKYGLESDEVAMIGDRIYTDVAAGRNAGGLGVLVLSGETSLETALDSDPVPELTAADISVVADLLLRAHGA